MSKSHIEPNKSLAPPQQDPPTEEPLRRSMEDLTLQNGNSPGASTDKESTTDNPKANRISRPKTKKKGKRFNNLKRVDSGAPKEEEAGRIVDPSGSVDPPHQNPEHDTSNESHEEHDKTITKYFACRYCDKSYEYHKEWQSILQEHKNIYHPTFKGNQVTPEDWYIISEYTQDTDDEDRGGVVVDLEAQDEEHTRYNLVTGVTMLIRTGNPLPNIAEGPMANIASPTQIIKLF